jgi:hypothetical protein
VIKQENPNFIASKYAPNPKEVSYWIDLATDSTGNVIKSYSPDLKKWTPLNRDANVDQRTHIKEIVQSVAEGTSTGTKVVNVPRYRGIENPFGHVWKNVIDVVVAGTDNSVYICKDYTKFGTFEGGTNPTAEQLIAAGYELQDFKESTITGQYVKKLVNNN